MGTSESVEEDVGLSFADAVGVRVIQRAKSEMRLASDARSATRCGSSFELQGLKAHLGARFVDASEGQMDDPSLGLMAFGRLLAPSESGARERRPRWPREEGAPFQELAAFFLFTKPRESHRDNMLHAATSMSAHPAISSPLRERRPSTASSSTDVDSFSDSGSSGSDTPTMDPLKATEPVKQTRQGKDWRPKSTLHHRVKAKDPSLRWYEKLVARGLMSQEYHELKPLDLDRGPIPKHSVLKEHAWILFRGLMAPAAQQLSYWYYPGES